MTPLFSRFVIAALPSDFASFQWQTLDNHAGAGPVAAHHHDPISSDARMIFCLLITGQLLFNIYSKRSV